jgi:hypothetical protein
LYFPEEARDTLAGIVISFLNPRSTEARAFVADNLNAYFFLTACGLSSDQLKYIEKLLGNPFDIEAFFDVDLLLATCGLFDSATNEQAESLLEFKAGARTFGRLEFVVAEITMNQGLSALQVASELTGSSASASINIRGPLHQTVQGLLTAFLSSGDRNYRTYLADWRSALHHSSRLMRIPIGDHLLSDPRVHADTRAYATMSGIGKDLMVGNDTEERMLHDIAMCYMVRELRGDDWSDLSQNRHWFVTTNELLLRFDGYSSKRGRGYPTCVHPFTLLQMLRLTMPRDEAWEIAALNGMCLPFLYSGDTGRLDDAATRVLGTLARYEGRGLREDKALASVLNAELRRLVSYAAQGLMQRDESELRILAEIDSIKESLKAYRAETE